MKKKLLIFCVLLYSCSAFSVEPIKFIVNANNSVKSLTQSQVRDYFLKKDRMWPDGTPLRFFDRNDGSPVRAYFLQNYIKRTPRQVQHHWIGQKLYSGDSSPSQVSTDSLAASLVSRFAGGMSYVSNTFSQTDGVKFIEVVGD